MVTVIISCALDPVPLIADGIIRLFTILSAVEERLKNILNSCFPADFEKIDRIVPNYKKWLVTMWHFGRDSLTDYYGEKFCVTVEAAQDILVRMYAKEVSRHSVKIRIERQEYPSKLLEDVIQEKLNGIQENKTIGSVN